MKVFLGVFYKMSIELYNVMARVCYSFYVMNNIEIKSTLCTLLIMGHFHQCLT